MRLLHVDCAVTLKRVYVYFVMEVGNRYIHILRRGGRLVLTSRTWELVRAKGSRLDVSDRLVRRNGRDAVVGDL